MYPWVGKHGAMLCQFSWKFVGVIEGSTLLEGSKKQQMYGHFWGIALVIRALFGLVEIMTPVACANPQLIYPVGGAPTTGELMQ